MDNNEEKIFNAILENFKKEYKIPKKTDAFNIFVPYQICKNKMISVEEAMESCVDGGNDGGIDNILIFVNDMLIKTKEDYEKLNIIRNPQNILEIFIMQNKKTSGFSPDALNKLCVTFQNIFDEKFNNEELEKNYNFDLIEQILLFRRIIEDIPNFYTDKISMNFIYSTMSKNVVISEHVLNSQELLIEHIKNNMCIDNVLVIYNGIKELKKLYDIGFSSSVQLKIKNMISDTYVDENNEACIILSTIDNYYEFLSSEEDELKEYLFEANIRDFQEKNNNVNEEILRTLNEQSNVDFWWLNNGITILVEDLEIKPKSLILTMPRIVNGLQTSYCIYENKKDIPPLFKIKDERCVLIKVIKTSNEKIMENIIFATNNQTPINTADLIANNPIQKNIEEYFKNKGYFYERRNNFYKRKREIDPSKIITKSTLFQCAMAVIEKSPSIARNNPKTIIYESNYSLLFNENIDIEIYFNIYKIYESLLDYIKSISKNEDPLNNKYGTSIVSFKLHLLLISVIIILNNNEYSVKELKAIDLNIEKSIFKRAVEVLEKILDQSNEINKLYYAKNKQIDEDIKSYKY